MKKQIDIEYFDNRYPFVKNRNGLRAYAFITPRYVFLVIENSEYGGPVFETQRYLLTPKQWDKVKVEREKETI